MSKIDYIELGKRAVACPKWRWMPGMRWWTEDDRGRLDDFQPEYMGRPPDSLPDLTDPATIGCLLALVRAAWGDLSLSVLFDHDGCKWRVGRWEDDGLALRCRHADTESEALVAALEAAP